MFFDNLVLKQLHMAREAHEDVQARSTSQVVHIGSYRIFEGAVPTITLLLSQDVWLTTSYKEAVYCRGWE